MTKHDGQPREDPIQFGLLPLFFLTAFFAALLMAAMAASMPLRYFDQEVAAARVSQMLAYSSLAFALAVATVLSMVKRAKTIAVKSGDAKDSTANALAPSDDKH